MARQPGGMPCRLAAAVVSKVCYNRHALNGQDYRRRSLKFRGITYQTPWTPFHRWQGPGTSVRVFGIPHQAKEFLSRPYPCHVSAQCEHDSCHRTYPRTADRTKLASSGRREQKLGAGPLYPPHWAARGQVSTVHVLYFIYLTRPSHVCKLSEAYSSRPSYTRVYAYKLSKT